MLIQGPKDSFPSGYTPITTIDGDHREMLTEFGIVRLNDKQRYTSTDDTERAFLLLGGTALIEWTFEGQTAEVELERHSVLDEEPRVVHVPAGTRVNLVEAGEGAEIAIQAVRNPTQFSPRVWLPEDYRSERFGEGTLQGTSTRIVRTIFDAATAPKSQMVLGEVVNYPGKWSSYPPHHHAQPELYHFRFFPDQGFGFSQQGKQVFMAQSRDTVTIPPNVVHPQTAAPGYAMYYIWMIPHLPNDRFGPDSRIFEKEHEWVMRRAAGIWPDVPISEVGSK